MQDWQVQTLGMVYQTQLEIEPKAIMLDASFNLAKYPHFGLQKCLNRVESATLVTAKDITCWQSLCHFAETLELEAIKLLPP